MTSDSHVALFRRLALELPGAVESSHMNHPDFRLNNRIFATLSAQEKGHGVVKLTPEQQEAFISEHPKVFSPVQGGWGRMGMTFVHLDKADEFLMTGALATAHHNIQKKQAEKKSSRSANSTSASRRRLQ
jgi:YjbR